VRWRGGFGDDAVVIVHHHADAQPLKLGAIPGGPGVLGIAVALRWGIHYTATHT